ncbi:hypothetical protein ACN28S_53395 [Cystobacter fuscus]
MARSFRPFTSSRSRSKKVRPRTTGIRWGLMSAKASGIVGAERTWVRRPSTS